MPQYNQTNNQYFSFNIGKIHFISIDYDYYYTINGTDIGQEMYDWVTNDLIQANATRDVRPWIIAIVHRPIYCSYSSPDDQPDKRCYAFYNEYDAFESLFLSYALDWIMCAHVHYWER